MKMITIKWIQNLIDRLFKRQDVITVITFIAVFLLCNMNHIWKAIFGSRILHVGIKEKQLLIENCLMWKDSQVLKTLFCMFEFFFSMSSYLWNTLPTIVHQISTDSESSID